MADNENYIENIQFGEDEEIYPIRDAEAVEKEGGELADTIVTYENEATTVSSFTDFISNFVSGTKIAKWFKDFRAGVEYILHVGSLVNNCVTDNSQLPLSAAQGKVLMDELTSVKSDLSEYFTMNSGSYIGDLNDLIIGSYRVGSVSQGLLNAPTNSYGGGYLLAFAADGTQCDFQICTDWNITILYFRSKWYSSWAGWRSISTSSV